MATFNAAVPGTISTEHFFNNASGTNTVNLAAGTYIYLDKFSATPPVNMFVAGIELQGSGVWTVNINGGISVSDSTGHPGFGQGMWIDNYLAASNNTINVSADSSVSGFNSGIGTTTASDIINSGYITSSRFGNFHSGVEFDGFNVENGVWHSNLTTGKAVSVTNTVTGIIGDFGDGTVNDKPVGINNSSYATVTITNAGEIDGGTTRSWDTSWHGAAMASEFGALVIGNSGTIYGNIETGWIGSSVTNNLSGVINGTIRAFIPNYADGLGKLGISNGVIDLNHDGNFTDFASGGAININDPSAIITTITNAGLIEGVSNYGLNDHGTVSTADDTYFKVALDLSNGKDVVNNTGTIHGDIWLNQGDDSITNSGFIRGWVDMGSGNNTAINSGEIRFGIGGNEGNDSITNSGLIGDIYGGGGSVVTLHGGNNSLTNLAGGQILGWVDMGDGNNTTINAGYIRDGMGGNGGIDTITNSGTIGGDITTHDGNDILTNSGQIYGHIFMGTGNDTVNGGNNSEYVVDEAGADKYYLGGGNDTAVVSNDGAADIYDGGAGIDTLDLSQVTVTASLNLAAKTLGIAGTIDTVLNFEKIIGTNQYDVLTGSNLAESISGGGGNDAIRGGGGADQLWGGAGNDTFTYVALSDSGTTRATIDTIYDFTKGQDHIRLTFDANTTNAAGTLDHFSSIIANGAFTHHAGELRYVFNGGTTQIEADVNGDGVADFAISLVGHIALTASDFIFS